MNRITTVVALLSRKFGRAVLVLSCLACLVLSTRAANRTWTTATSGDFGAAGSWTGGVPGAGDTATFDKVGTYTVTFDNTNIPVLPNPELNQDLFFQAGTVTFISGSGGPYTYQFTGSGGDDAVVTGGSLTLGTSGNPLSIFVDDDLRIRGGASVIANFGSDVRTTDLFLGDSTAPAGDGTLVIDGTGSLLRVGTTAQIGIGGETGTLIVRNNATADFNGTINLADGSNDSFNTGILNVQSGAAITTASIRIGNGAFSGQMGTLTVGSGIGTSASVTQDINSALVVGATLAGPTPNVATLNVDPHGVFNSGSGTGTITVNRTGTINLIGTLNALGDVTINGGVMQVNSANVFALAAGKTLLVTGGGRATFGGNGYSTATDAIYLVGGTSSKLESATGPLFISKNAVVQVSAGGLIFTNGIGIGDAGGDGSLEVTGNGSSVIASGTGASFWGQNGNRATVDFNSDAAGSFSGGIELDEGFVDVGTGADLTVGPLTITSFDQTAGVFVEGLGSTVTQIGASTLFVGDPNSDGTGTSRLFIGTFSSGATFTTGTGLTTINKTGTVAVGSASKTGTLFANGNVTIDGGVLQYSNGLFELAAGRTMTIQNGGRFTVGIYATDNAIYNVIGPNSKLESSIGGVVRIYHGGRVNVSAGGLVSSDASIPIGQDGNGRLTVDGTGSTALASGTGTSFWGQSGNTATVIFSNNALGTFNGGIEMANTTVAGSTAVVNIQSGADLTVAGKLLLAGLNGATSATLNVQGAGSTITQTGANVLTVGHASAGTATVSILDGGAITTGTGIVTVAPTGTVLLGGISGRGTLSANGAMTVRGSLQVGQQPVDAGGALNVTAGLTVDGGTVHLVSGVIDANSISLTNGGVFDVDGGTLHVDLFNGNLVNEGGTLAPGHSAGNTTIVGSYTQQAAAALEIEIGGLSAGSNYDLVGVAGTVILGGELRLAVIGPFVPAAADTFTVMNATGVFGVFSNVTTGQRLTTLDGSGSFRVNYGAGSTFDNDQVVLSAFQAVALPGDYNLNGTVDGADYVVWRKAIGLAADGNGNGQIDNGDYTIWRAHFGQPPGSGAGASANSTVPEPPAMVLLMFAATSWCLRRGRAA